MARIGAAMMLGNTPENGKVTIIKAAPEACGLSEKICGRSSEAGAAKSAPLVVMHVP